MLKIGDNVRVKRDIYRYPNHKFKYTVCDPGILFRLYQEHKSSLQKPVKYVEGGNIGIIVGLFQTNYWRAKVKIGDNLYTLRFSSIEKLPIKSQQK